MVNTVEYEEGTFVRATWMNRPVVAVMTTRQALGISEPWRVLSPIDGHSLGFASTEALIGLQRLEVVNNDDTSEFEENDCSPEFCGNCACG